MFGGVRFVELPQFITRLFPRLDTPSLMRNMALVIDTGKPMVEGISLAAYFYPSPGLRRTLSQIEVAVRHADDCFHQMHKHRLITKSEEQLLRSAERVGNLSWALRHLAQNLERRYWYRFRLTMEFVKPLVIFGFGLLVLGFAVSFFMPMVTLLTQLVEQSNI